MWQENIVGPTAGASGFIQLVTLVVDLSKLRVGGGKSVVSFPNMTLALPFQELSGS